MTYLHAWVAVILALATSSSALAQSVDADSVPSTRADWELMRNTLEWRVETAERRLSAARKTGDADDEAVVARELEARKAALKRFEQRTMARKPGMVGGAALLMGFGGVGLILAALPSLVISDPPKERWGTTATALAITSGAIFAAGVPFLIIGARKTWVGPEEARSARLVVGPGHCALSGSF